MALTDAQPGQIDAIKAHLAAGNQVAIVTYGRITKLTAKHADYIRADGEGYRLGWPGKKSVYAFAHIVKFVPAGYRL